MDSKLDAPEPIVCEGPSDVAWHQLRQFLKAQVQEKNAQVFLVKPLDPPAEAAAQLTVASGSGEEGGHR